MNCNSIEKSYPDGDVRNCLAFYGDRKQVFKRGRINIDFGDAGIGKSTFQLLKNICFAFGHPFYDLIPIREIHCLYFNTEQDFGDIKRRYLERFLRLHPEGSKVRERVNNNLEIYDDSEFQVTACMSKEAKNDRIIKMLEEKVDAFRKTRGLSEDVLMMLTIDPVFKWWFDCIGSNSNCIPYLITPLGDLSKRKNLAITLVFHTHRTTKGNRLTLNDIQGGHNIVAGIDSVFAYEAIYGRNDPRRTITCLKGEMESYSKDISCRSDESKLLGDFEISKSAFDCYPLRVMPKTKSGEVYSLLKTIYPWRIRSDGEAISALRSLTYSGVIHKITGKNEYVGSLFEEKPKEIVTDINQLNERKLA